MLHATYMRYIALVILVTFGCGSGSEPRDQLAETAWASPVEGFSCEKGFEFGPAGEYTFAIACTLTDGTLGGYVETGEYSTEGDQMVTVARKASCPAEQVQQVFIADFRMTATTLTLIVPGGTTTYDRLTPSTPLAGTVGFGCFDSTGAFFYFPLTPL